MENLYMAMFAQDNPDHLIVKSLKAIDKLMLEHDAKVSRINQDMTMNGAMKSAKIYESYLTTKQQIETITDMSKMELNQSTVDVRSSYVGNLDGLSDVELLSLAKMADGHNVEMVAGSSILRKAYLAREKVEGKTSELLETAYAQHQMQNPDLMTQHTLDSQADEILGFTVSTFTDNVGDMDEHQRIFESMVN